MKWLVDEAYPDTGTIREVLDNLLPVIENDGTTELSLLTGPG